MKTPNYKKTIFACYRAAITQGIIVNLMPLFFIIFQNSYNISFVMLGNLVLLNFVTQLSTDAVSIKFVEKIGYRAAAVLAHGLATVGLALLGILPLICPVIPALVISTVIFSIGGGFIEVVASPIVESVPGDEKEKAMSILHSFYCWGVVGVILITTALLRIIGHSRWMILPILWAILPAYNTIAFLKVPIIPPPASDERTPLKELFSSKVFILILVLMLCSGASELCISQWASLFSEKALGISKTLGDILGPCFFAIAMGIGRLLYGIYGQKIDLLKAQILCSILCIISYIMCCVTSSSIISFIGIALCGFSVSIMWPGMISYAASIFKSGGAALFALLALSGDIGCSLGPWVVGAVSELVISLGEISALKIGVFAGMIFPIVMLLGVLYLKRKKNVEKEGSGEVEF